MKSFEALLSLLAVVSFSLMVLQQHAELDDALYKYQLANDVWRIWYLKGHLATFDKHGMNSDAEKITELTGNCIYLEEEDVASCIGKEKISTVHKKAWVEDRIENITLVISREGYD